MLRRDLHVPSDCISQREEAGGSSAGGGGGGGEDAGLFLSPSLLFSCSFSFSSSSFSFSFSLSLSMSATQVFPSGRKHVTSDHRHQNHQSGPRKSSIPSSNVCFEPSSPFKPCPHTEQSHSTLLGFFSVWSLSKDRPDKVGIPSNRLFAWPFS